MVCILWAFSSSHSAVRVSSALSPCEFFHELVACISLHFLIVSCDNYATQLPHCNANGLHSVGVFVLSQRSSRFVSSEPVRIFSRACCLHLFAFPHCSV